WRSGQRRWALTERLDRPLRPICLLNPVLFVQNEIWWASALPHRYRSCRSSVFLPLAEAQAARPRLLVAPPAQPAVSHPRRCPGTPVELLVRPTRQPGELISVCP